MSEMGQIFDENVAMAKQQNNSTFWMWQFSGGLLMLKDALRTTLEFLGPHLHLYLVQIAKR